MPTQQDSTESLGYSILPTYSIGNFLNDFKKQPTIFADIKDQMREKKCSAKDAMNDMILSSRDNERTRILKSYLELKSLESGEILERIAKAIKHLFNKLNNEDYNQKLVEKQLSEILLKNITPQIVDMTFQEAEEIRQSRIKYVAEYVHFSPPKTRTNTSPERPSALIKLSDYKQMIMGMLHERR